MIRDVPISVQIYFLLPFSPTQAEVGALRVAYQEMAEEVGVGALSALVHALRTALANVGLIRGGA